MFRTCTSVCACVRACVHTCVCARHSQINFFLLSLLSSFAQFQKSEPDVLNGVTWHCLSYPFGGGVCHPFARPLVLSQHKYLCCDIIHCQL